MLRRVAAFEWRFQVRSPVFWVGFLIFFLLPFGATTVSQIQIGSLGNVHKNAPFALLQTLGVMNVFLTFVVVAMVAGAVVRDDETGFAPLLRSTALRRTDYLVGRFAGAVAAAFLVMAAVPLGVLVGTWMPWVDPEKLGPFRALDYLYALFVFGLPSLLIVAAGFFALATATRSMMWAYVGAVAALVGYLVMRILLRDPAHDAVASMADPFGMAALGVATKYWTAAERNTLLPPVGGLLLANRLLWSAVALAMFAVTVRLFRFENVARLGRRARQAAAARPAAAAATAVAVSDPDLLAAQVLLPRRPGEPRRGVAALPAIPPATPATRRAQWWALARHDMSFVFRNPAYAVLLVIALLNAGASLWFTGDYYGSPSWPVTRLMADALEGSFWIFAVLIAIYYGGELVWRDRDRRMHEIVDATAAPDWAHVLPKVLALAGVLASTALVGVVAAVAVQSMKGYFHWELGGYVLWFLLPASVQLVQVAVLSVFVQVISPQKYIGWAVMALYLIGGIALPLAGFQDHLYLYGSTPGVPLSDMNGMGRFWIGRAWFEVYWSAAAGVLVVLSHALWRRGASATLGPRLRLAGRRLRGATLAVLAAALATGAAAGAWIYYNTHVLNRFVTSNDVDRFKADYEKALLRYEHVPRPRVVSVTLDVQLYPRQARAVTTGTYVLVNRTGAPIDAIHLAWDARAQLTQVRLDGATVQQDWPRLHYRIYRLATPMQPGERRTLGFTTVLAQRGFSNARPLTRIVRNGTFLDNIEIAPRLGVSRDGLLKDRTKRRRYGLPPELRSATLEDEAARADNVLTHDADWVDADITVGTDADQTPVAPGVVVSDLVRTVDGHRRHEVRFRTDAPINLFFSVQSARYAVARDSLQLDGHPVDLAVYHDPAHAYNVDRMLRAMKLALTLYDQRFGPYPFHQARIVEFPAYGTFAQSFANTIPYSEDIGFIGRYDDPTKIDVATYVTAHEIAHQWWGHQLVPADKQGAAMLTETFAQYSALLVMERLYGHDQVRKFLKYELDAYLRSRGAEVVEELPLDRVEDQGYIHYRKGALAMYWLKEVVGEDVVDRSMAELLKQYRFKGAPYPDTRDFLAILRREAGPSHDALITDLFDRITLLDLKASSATARRRPDGRWDVRCEVDAHKFLADGKGVETEAPMDEPVAFGVFSAEPGTRDFRASDVLLLDKRRIASGRQRVEAVVAQPPAWCGIDPYNERIDRNADDNLVKVKLE